MEKLHEIMESVGEEEQPDVDISAADWLRSKVKPCNSRIASTACKELLLSALSSEPERTCELRLQPSDIDNFAGSNVGLKVYVALSSLSVA